MTEKTTFFEDALSGTEQTFFNCFEPFDVNERPEWEMEAARRDEVDIDPRGGEFQIGMLMDTQRSPGMAMAIAGSQDGKSITGLIESVIMASGQVPISMRYPKGVDTGVKRIVNEENINRFGLNAEGNCGNIIGVGIYPKEKIPPPGNQIWICTYKEAKEKMWRKKFTKIIPPYFLDTSKGVNGFSESKQTYFFTNGNTISFVTYEQDYHRVEAEKAWLIILDEEPPDRRFYISAIEHCRYLRAYFTPINGLSWMYHEIYLPIIRGENHYCKIYTCSQYDSPYHNRAEIDTKRKTTYKPYEIKARVWGQFSDMAGKPYYTFEITQNLLKLYVPRHTLGRILPPQRPETVKDALKLKMVFEPASEMKDDTWEIYEEYLETDTYWLAADIAEGNENPDAAQDGSAAYVRRLPREGEKDPQMVSALYSRLRNVEFSWLCLYAAIYYNYCLMAPEARGEDAAVFLTTIINYPFIYKHVVTSDKTHRQKEVEGFDTTVGNRKLIFDLNGTWIYDRPDNPRIHHYRLLKEFSECIVGKNGRPDHGDQGSTDCLLAYGISQYVFQFARHQIRNNRNQRFALTKEPEPSTFPNLLGRRMVKETRKILGSDRGLDRRSQYDKQYRSIHPNRGF
jgi:hypothetical protein